MFTGYPPGWSSCRRPLVTPDAVQSRVTIVVATYERAALLDRLLGLNVGPAARAGSLFTVDVASFGSRAPFLNTHGPSFRQVVDLADPDGAGMILTTGEAGNPVSRHYRDQVSGWWDGRLAREPVALLEAAGAGTLRLTPGP